MNFKWFGPLALLAALVIGDQIRINRPAHKYRLTVEVETPEGRKSASGVMAVHPDRSYTRRGQTRTLGDAVFVDLGQGKNLVALLAHLDNNLVLDDMNYVALRAYMAAAGKRVPFSEMSRLTGTVPVKGALIPVLVSLRRSGHARHGAGGAGRTMPKRCSGRAIASREYRPKWCRTDTGRSISAARWASRSRAEFRRNCHGSTVPAIRRPRRSGRPVCPGSTASTPREAFTRK